MEVRTIIVQAGGKGSRLQYLTANKPKCLVPVDNLPLLFHLFRHFPKCHFIVIGDYKYDVLEKYLKAFASDVRYDLVSGQGKSGTCGGLSDALRLVPETTPFALIWCDLLLPKDYSLPKLTANYVGVSRDFPCRWKYEEGKFEEERSTTHGVAGFFIFQDKSQIADVPEEGEFVRYLSKKNINFAEEPLLRTHEYGLLEEWDKLPKRRTRPFNELVFDGSKAIKRPLDDQGKSLAIKEQAWYKKAEELGINEFLPTIYSYDPLTMEIIDGQALYETGNKAIEEKAALIADLVLSLKTIHNASQVAADVDSFWEAYYEKTFQRLEKVRDLVPFADIPVIKVNGRACLNPFFKKKEIRSLLERYIPKQFSFIHGDCTFSNTMLRADGRVCFIDPRGYFGHTQFYGDPAYDWAKLYYSIYGNYDQFNLRRFRLSVGEDGAHLEIASNGYESLDTKFLENISNEVTAEQITLYHALIWLSLTTYAWEDYDSICGAFYNGVYLLAEALK